MKKTNSHGSSGNKFHLKLPAKSENLDIIRKFVAGIAENVGFNEDEIYQIELAVDEACANVVRHAYRGIDVPHPEILVTVRTRKNGIEISIADRGKGFDPDKLPTPDMDEYLKKMKPGGLGVHLIKSLMDKVTFSIKPGVRNEVKMVKIHNNG
jgi:serine/threonine-protein kinase RsbW